jgi:hypothetical protein
MCSGFIPSYGTPLGLMTSQGRTQALAIGDGGGRRGAVLSLGVEDIAGVNGAVAGAVFNRQRVVEDAAEIDSGQRDEGEKGKQHGQFDGGDAAAPALPARMGSDHWTSSV